MTVRLAPSFEVVSVPSDAVIEFAVERIITRLKRADGDQSPASGRRYPTRTCCRTCCRTCFPSRSIRRHRKHGPKATSHTARFPFPRRTKLLPQGSKYGGCILSLSMYLRANLAKGSQVLINLRETFKSDDVNVAMATG
jgi:hypothetical protein